ncbi:hypothetical protein PGT21_035467 [Puccinia graminis f. sp. tritici]|uniref:HMG box domain-containing protein n=1 Tax=Puccinia graminis f. sp. tritici TaxID=56615 RepID=A0A5B0MR69_PUCGR|nr:hypothetical protein PGT21_035467 [Puccinia graminis f. sp. tritici]
MWPSAPTLRRGKKLDKPITPRPSKSIRLTPQISRLIFDLHSLSAGPHHPPANSADHDPSGGYATSKPVLETDGVVSSEVGDVPGILHQDLHPDGQPRRPMNAFMIFARHRRPAIQAKEPGLKTGEISKRLSHDWKNLPEEDKSHYLEQAKLLKDEFHSRFPEYVYKRRPNNTGKRRSSTSQQQMHAKFACGPGGPQSMNLPPGSIHNGMPHPADVHHYHHHLHPSQGDLYNQGHPHHLAHHHHVQPPRALVLYCTALSQITQLLLSIPKQPYLSQVPSPRPTCPGFQLRTLINRHPGPYSSRAPPPTSTTTVAPSAIHSPRPGSPNPPSSAAPNGMSYIAFLTLIQSIIRRSPRPTNILGSPTNHLTPPLSTLATRKLRCRQIAHHLAIHRGHHLLPQIRVCRHPDSIVPMLAIQLSPSATVVPHRTLRATDLPASFSG